MDKAGAEDWPPSLIEWALNTLPRYLDAGRRSEMGGLQREWQQRQLQALSDLGDDDRLQALGELERVNWLPELEPAADELQARLIGAADLGELEAVAEMVLESGLLRLVEQNEHSIDDSLRLFGQELQLLEAVRRELRLRSAEAKAAGRESRQRQLLRRLSRIARRLRNQSDEAVLHRRLVRFFGEGRVRLFSKISLTALFALLLLILVDLFVPAVGWWMRFVFWADTLICFLFLWEFLVRLLLAPRRPVWFLRHFLTDFVPALPFALLLHPGTAQTGGAAGAEFLLRSVRILRVPVYVRSLRFLKPAVAAFRMIVFGVRGLDRLVQGLAPVLNREIVFFEREDRPAPLEDLRVGGEGDVIGGFLRLGPDKRAEQAPALFEELQARITPYRQGGAPLSPLPLQQPSDSGRSATMLPVEEAIESLRALRPEDVEEALPPEIVRSLGRVLRAFNLPVIRWIPLLGRLVRRVKGDTAGELVASAGRLIAGHFQSILGFIHAWADLAGVITAPQILDRIGSALAKSTQRPAVRLLMFGSLFLLARLVVEGILGISLGEGLKSFLERFVYGPLLIVGLGALALLLLARWFKRIAGEATDRLGRLSEARFANLMELVHCKNEGDDRSELVARVHRSRAKEAEQDRLEIEMAMDELRGRLLSGGQLSPVTSRARRLALLLLDAQDGGFLHVTNQKTTEQFLAHPDLVILRRKFLHLGRKERKRLLKLDLERSGLMIGPHFWFEQITHAVSIKVARLCSSYNLHALPLEQRDHASPEELDRHQRLVAGADDLAVEPGAGLDYKSSFFHVLHFLTPDKLWLEEVQRVFGPELRERLEKDRQRLVRCVFGTRPLHELPRDLRSFNPFHFYTGRLSGGRFLLLPIKLLFVWIRLLWVLGRLAYRSVREILDPRRGSGERSPYEAPFAVAQRKLRRMKKPLLLEAMHLLGRVDPQYFGLGVSGGHDEPGLYSHDLEILAPTSAERRRFDRLRETLSSRLLYFPDFVETLASSPVPETAAWQRLYSAFGADEKRLATLATAEARARAWRIAFEQGEDEASGALLSEGLRVPKSAAKRGLERMLAFLEVEDRRERRAFFRAFGEDRGDLRRVAFAFALAGEAGPGALAQETAAAMLDEANGYQRCLETARAVLSLIVFDLRHHERLVYELGGYDEDAPELPSYVHDQPSLEKSA